MTRRPSSGKRLQRFDVKALVRDERRSFSPSVAANAVSTISPWLSATLSGMFSAMAMASMAAKPAVVLVPAAPPPTAGLPRESAQV